MSVTDSTPPPGGEITASHLAAARHRLAGVAHRTPILTCRTLDRLTGTRLFFKCESFQRGGAFKFRGAYNTVASLDAEERRRGVVTHSSGNHGQALALAGQTFEVPVRVVMPRDAPAVKRSAVAGYGAEVILCEPTLEARQRTCAEVIERTGATLVHPYDDPRIIAGQSTVAAELLEDVPDLDALLVPIGGGGLASGTALAAHHASPSPRVIAVEPAGADDAARSLAAGRLLPMVNPRTLADGLRSSLSPRTFDLVRRLVERVETVTEDAIIRAMRLLFERMKLVVEPSGAVPLAALLGPEGAAGLDLANRRVGVVLSGGNVDLDRLPWSL